MFAAVGAAWRAAVLRRPADRRRSPVRLLWIALGLVAIFAVGILAEQLYLRAVRDAPPRGATGDGSGQGRLLLLALLLDFIGIVVFALATIGAFFVLHQGHARSVSLS